MQEKWYVEENNIIDGDCKDDAIVCGNAGIKFIDIFKTLEKLDWQGFEIIYDGILIDIKIARNLIAGNLWLANPNEFSISDGVIRIWYD